MKVVEGRMYCFVKEVVYGEVKASYFKLRGELVLAVGCRSLLSGTRRTGDDDVLEYVV